MLPVASTAFCEENKLDSYVSRVTIGALMNPPLDRPFDAPAEISRPKLRVLGRRFLTACSLAFLVLLGGIQNGSGFALNGFSWPYGSPINIHLQLTGPPVPLQDGSASWNASAADALAIWNQYLDKTPFVEGAGAAPSGGDGVNSAFFSGTMYGEAFPAGVLAVTIYYSSSGSTFSETDVIFNDGIQWDSYRGPVQVSGGTPTFDLHRVALHEFGHVLGLSHPDQHQQNVHAMMNSIISNLDHLTDDDIAGARSIYRPKLTSSLFPPAGRSGDHFVYRVTANNSPTSYSATGLPSGLQLDAGTGLISGACRTSGTFPVDVTVQGASGIASGRVQIVITPLPITSSSLTHVPIGDSFSYQILAENNPTSYDATGLPAGLALNTTTGLISGSPQVTGTFAIRLIARSAISEAAGNMTLAVGAPRITSPSRPPPVEVGEPFSYQITATVSPTGFAVSNLPPGMHCDPATGLISGSSTVPGFFSVLLTVQTPHGNAFGSVGIEILTPRITSPSSPPAVDIGNSFSYQITASGRPTSYSAIGLPAGLQIDTASGLISGIPTLSGFHTITVIAHGSRGDLSMQVHIFVTKLYTGDTPAARIPVPSLQALVADPHRPRVYTATSNAIWVIDAQSLAVIKTIAVPFTPADLSVSVDGSKLWVATLGTAILGRIDLENLSVLASLPIAEPGHQVREGLDQRLYLSSSYGSGVAQIDGVTGALQARFNPETQGAPSRCTMEISPDRKFLFVGNFSSVDPRLARYDISTGTPALAQSVPAPEANGQGSLSVSHSGQLVSYGDAQSKPVRSAADLNVVLNSFSSPGNFLGSAAFAADDTLIFQSIRPPTDGTQNKIAVLDTSTWQVVRTLTLPEVGRGLARMVVDKTNSHLFTYTSWGGFVTPPDLLAYPVHPTVSTITPAPKSLLNVSTRLRSQGGENVLIGGFIITGAEPKKLALRAIGPSLPLMGKLADPVLELYDGTPTLIGQNDNWNAHRADVLATGIPPADEREAVIPATLQPGSYTVVVRGLNSLSGVALVEAYDLTSDSNSKLANISTRGKVESGDNVMIGGFIIGGNEETAVVVRAIGPSLTNFGIAGALADPTLAVHDSNGALLAQDDDWRVEREQQLIGSGLAPTHDREAAMRLSLQPGAYTAVVRGKDNGTGVGLVEIYNLDAN